MGASWCGCEEAAAAQLRIAGRAVTISRSGALRVAGVHSACVRCGTAQLPDGALTPLSGPEHRALSDLALPVSYARNAIRNRRDIDPLALPTVEQLGELGLVRPIRSDYFYDARGGSDADVRAHMRGLFSIPDGAEQIWLTPPGVRRGIIVGPDFVEHPLQDQRRLTDPGHMRFSSLAPMTVLEATEILLVRAAGGGRSLKFLGAYRDLSLPPRTPYVYHVAYALGDGRLTTSFRLAGGAQAFRQEREGRLLYASYAEPVAGIILPSAS
jgi:hypothetical protein